MKPVPHAFTDQAPALTIAPPGAQVCLAWKSPSPDTTIWYSTSRDDPSSDNLNWTAPVQVQGKGWTAETEQGPALTVASDGLYVAWKGKGSSTEIWYSRWDGTSWTAQATVPNAKTASAPSLATISGGAAVAWLAGDSIAYTTFPSGVDNKFGEGPPDSGVSGSGTIGNANAKPNQTPALGGFVSVLPGLLFAWVKSDNTLWYTNVGGTQPVLAQLKGSGFKALSSAGPALPSQTLYSPSGLAWKGESESVWVSKNFPSLASPDSATQQMVAGASTNVAPAWLGSILPGQWGILAFVAHNLTVDGGIAVKDGQIWVCIP
jgi:hypothetical protein